MTARIVPFLIHLALFGAWLGVLAIVWFTGQETDARAAGFLTVPAGVGALFVSAIHYLGQGTPPGSTGGPS